MSEHADLLVDRRRLKRGLLLWRTLAVIAFAAAALALLVQGGEVSLRDHIARIAVEDLIVADAARIEALDAVADNERAKALIVRIDSPGGTFVGGESLFRALRRVAAKKPVVAVMETMATSAAYMTALGADRIFAHEGTVTGSIGVILQTTDITGLLAKLGISAEAIKSGPLKATPSPLEPLTDEVRRAAQDIIDDMFESFLAMVAERRGLDRAAAETLADGRVYSGRQALELGLVDALGDEVTARQWLVDAQGLEPDLPVNDIGGDELDTDWLAQARALAAGAATGLFGNLVSSEPLILDGLVSVWHPAEG